MLTDAIFVCASCFAFHPAAIGIETARAQQKQKQSKSTGNDASMTTAT